MKHIIFYSLFLLFIALTGCNNNTNKSIQSPDLPVPASSIPILTPSSESTLSSGQPSSTTNKKTITRGAEDEKSMHGAAGKGADA